MKHFSFIIVLAIALSASVGHAATAEALLTRDILVSAKTLKTDTKIYNYFTLQEVWQSLQTEEGRIAYIKNYLAARAGAFWNPEFNDDSTKNYAAGAALYFAIDPLISETFGNSFIELVIPSGTRFINVVRPLPLKKDTQQALIAEGFLVQKDFPILFPKQTGFYRDTLRAMVAPQFSNFRKLVQKIFEDNTIQFVEYNFNTSLGGFCTKHSYSAFAYVGLRNPTNDKEAIVVPQFARTTINSSLFNFPNKTQSEQNNFDSIIKFKSLLQRIADSRKIGKPIKTIISETYTPDEVKAVKASTFSCDN